MPRALPTVSRRRVLLGTAVLAVLSGTSTVACGTTPPVEDVAALVEQLDRARTDNQLAVDAALAAPPAVAAALTAVAAERAKHAQALTDEITRMSNDAPAATTTTTTTTTTASGVPPKPPSAAEVVTALEQSATGASLLAAQQSGYRAGLMGSIAAACTTAATVALAVAGPTS